MAARPISIRSLVIETMLCLQPGSALREALAPFLKADSETLVFGVELLEEQVVVSTALRTARRLEHIPFLEWADGPRKAWLQSQAWITLEIEPACLVTELEARGVVVVNFVEGDGRVTYNFAALLALLAKSDLIRQGLIPQEGLRKIPNLEVFDASLEASFFGSLAKTAFCQWLFSLGCIHSWSTASSIGVDIATVSVRMALMLKEELPRVIRFLASTAPPFIAKIDDDVSAGSSAVRAALIGRCGSTVKALEKKLGLRIVIEGEQVLCWLSVDALPQKPAEGFAEQLSIQFRRSTSAFQAELNVLRRRVFELESGGVLRARVVQRCVSAGLSETDEHGLWSQAYSYAPWNESFRYYRYDEHFLPRRPFSAAEYIEDDGYSSHGGYDKYDEDDDACWDTWDEMDSMDDDSEQVLAPLTRDPGRMMQISVQGKIKHNKRLAQLAAKESRDKVRREQHKAPESRLLVRGGRHKVDPKVYPRLLVEGVDY